MSKKNQVEVSIVTPMHNEEKCLEEFYRRVTDSMRAMNTTYEIVLVNDGSTDKTSGMIRDICSRDKRVKGVFLSRNRGQCIAIYAGIQHSTGKYVVVMDGDLQHKPEEIHLLVEEIRKGYDLVSGGRVNRQESMLLRRFPSRVANYLMRWTSKCEVRDMGGFSCIRGKIARSMRLRSGQHRLLPALVYIMGGSVSEVPVSAPPRFAGQSHYGIGRSIDVLFDIIMLWFQTSFKQRPVYLFGRISLILFAVASLIMVWLLYGKVFYGIHMGTRPPFLGAVLFYLASFGSMSTGFILEMILNTLDSVNGSTTYVVREFLNGGEAE